MTELFPPDYLGGAEISISEIASRIGLNNEVVVFTPSYGRPSGLEKADNFHILRYPNMFRPKGSHLEQKLLFFIEMAKHLAIFTRTFRPEVVDAQNALSVPAVEKIGRIHSLFPVAHVRDHRFECFTSRLACPSHNDATLLEFTRCVDRGVSPLLFPYAKIVTRTIRKALVGCGRAIAVSNYLRNELLNKLNIDVKSIYDGVDLEKIEAIEPVRDIDGKFFEPNETIFFAGGLNRSKGVLELLDGFKQVIVTKDTAQLLIAGNGPLRRSVEELIQDEGMERNVTLLGALPYERTIATLKAAGMVVVPSLLPEAGSRVIMEAFACGKPVVASGRGANPEMVGNAGIAVPPKAHNIALAILEIMQDEYRFKELCALARRRSTMFSLKTTCDRLLESYEEWLNAR